MPMNGHAACTVPDPVSGTRHNGTLAVYNSGDVLLFSCYTGYTPNYNNPISTCLDSGNWNPANLTCNLDILSLVIAVVVALIVVLIFTAIVVCLLKRKRHAERSPRMTRRPPRFPEHPPTDLDVGRPVSLYDSIKIEGHTSGTIPIDSQGCHDVAMTVVSGGAEEADSHVDVDQHRGDRTGYDVLKHGPISSAGSGGKLPASNHYDFLKDGMLRTDERTDLDGNPGNSLPEATGATGSIYDALEPVAPVTVHQSGKDTERPEPGASHVTASNRGGSKTAHPQNSNRKGDQRAVRKHNYENVEVAPDGRIKSEPRNYENLPKEKFR